MNVRGNGGKERQERNLEKKIYINTLKDWKDRTDKQERKKNKTQQSWKNEKKKPDIRK